MKEKIHIKKAISLTLILAIGLVLGFAAGTDTASAASKPAKVTLTSAHASGQHAVVIKWKKAKGAKGYQIYRNGSLVKRVSGANTKSYTDTGLAAGTNYNYKVNAYKTKKTKEYYNKKTKKWQKKRPKKKYRGGTRTVTKYISGKMSPQKSARTASAPAASIQKGSSQPATGGGGMTPAPAAPAENITHTASAADPVAPATPTNLTATVTEANIQLTWTASSGATGYEVYRSESQTFTVKPVYYSAQAKYCDTSVEKGKTYYYKVVAYKNASDQTGFSTESAVVSATMPTEGGLPDGVSFVNNGFKISPPDINLTDEDKFALAIGLDNGSSTPFPLYKVYRDGDYVKTITATYTESNAQTGHTYHYELVPCLYYKSGGVYVYNDIEGMDHVIYDITYTGNASSFANVQATQPLVTAPTNCHVAAETYSVTLTWKNNPRATKANIYRNGSKIATVTEEAYVDNSVAKNTVYTYAISSVYANGAESAKKTMKVRTKTDAVAPPTTPTQNYDPNWAIDMLPNCKLNYNGTTIYLGQQWTQTLASQLAQGSSGTDSVVRRLFIKRYKTDPTGFVTAQKTLDELIYMIDVGDYDHFLAVYVINGQITSWATNMEIMGIDGSSTLMREQTSGFPTHIGNKFVPYSNWGIYIGGLRHDSESTSSNWDENYKNIPDERRIALHYINAFRESYNQSSQFSGKKRMPLQQNAIFIEGRYTGEANGHYCDNKLFGAQPWADTMYESLKAGQSNAICHSGYMIAGPLATPEGQAGSGASRSLIAFASQYKAPGENVGTGSTGESCVMVYQGSSGHIGQILGPDYQYVGIGISKGSVHCEIYGQDK